MLPLFSRSTSDIIFFNSKCVFAWPNFSIILFNSIISKRQYYESGKQRFIWDALRDLIPYEQFIKRQKHPWRSVTFNTFNFNKSNTRPWVLFTFLNCTNGTTLHKASHLDWYTNAHSVSLNSKTPTNQPIGIYELVHWTVYQK